MVLYHLRWFTWFLITVSVTSVALSVAITSRSDTNKAAVCITLHGQVGEVSVTGELRGKECVLVGSNGLVYASEPVSVFEDLSAEQRDQQVAVLLAGK